MVEANAAKQEEIVEDAEDKILNDAKIYDPQADSLDETSSEFTVRDP